MMHVCISESIGTTTTLSNGVLRVSCFMFDPFGHKYQCRAKDQREEAANANDVVIWLDILATTSIFVRYSSGNLSIK